MAVSTSSGGSARTFLAVPRWCKRRGGASSAAAGRKHAARLAATAQRCRRRTMVGSRGSICAICAAFARFLVSSCSGVWWLRALLVAQALNAASGAYWQLHKTYHCLYYRFCCDFWAFSRPSHFTPAGTMSLDLFRRKQSRRRLNCLPTACRNRNDAQKGEKRPGARPRGDQRPPSHPCGAVA